MDRGWKEGFFVNIWMLDPSNEPPQYERHMVGI